MRIYSVFPDGPSELRDAGHAGVVLQSKLHQPLGECYRCEISNARINCDAFLLRPQLVMLPCLAVRAQAGHDGEVSG